MVVTWDFIVPNNSNISSTKTGTIPSEGSPSMTSLGSEIIAARDGGPLLFASGHGQMNRARGEDVQCPHVDAAELVLTARPVDR
jgi:hypothetical protein